MKDHYDTGMPGSVTGIDFQVELRNPADVLTDRWFLYGVPVDISTSYMTPEGGTVRIVEVGPRNREDLARGRHRVEESNSSGSVDADADSVDGG